MGGRNTRLLRRDHAPYRGQMAKAERVVQKFKALRSVLCWRKLPMSEQHYLARLAWHQAWVDYGNSLGKKRVSE